MAGETAHPAGPAVLTPETPAARLVQLAVHEDQAVRAAVAAHPNTPADVLGKLAPEFPGEVLGNPALPLLRLAHPRLVHDWPRDTLLRLIRNERAPEWLRRVAMRHPRAEYQVALASNPHLTGADIGLLARHASWQVRAKIAGRPELPPDVLALLTADPDYGVRLYVAARANLPAASVGALRRDPSLFVRQVLEKAQQGDGTG